MNIEKIFAFSNLNTKEMFEPMFAEASAEGRAGAERSEFAKTSSNFFKNQLTKGVRGHKPEHTKTVEFGKCRIKALFIHNRQMPN
jgi:hypothetical protein